MPSFGHHTMTLFQGVALYKHALHYSAQLLVELVKRGVSHPALFCVLLCALHTVGPGGFMCKRVSTCFLNGSARRLTWLEVLLSFATSTRHERFDSERRVVFSSLHIFSQTMLGALPMRLWLTTALSVLQLWSQAEGGGVGNFPLCAAAAGSFQYRRTYADSSTRLSFVLCSAVGRGWWWLQHFYWQSQLSRYDRKKNPRK